MCVGRSMSIESIAARAHQLAQIAGTQAFLDNRFGMFFPASSYADIQEVQVRPVALGGAVFAPKDNAAERQCRLHREMRLRFTGCRVRPFNQEAQHPRHGQQVVRHFLRHLGGPTRHRRRHLPSCH